MKPKLRLLGEYLRVTLRYHDPVQFYRCSDSLQEMINAEPVEGCLLKISFVAGDGVNLEIASAHIGINYCEIDEEPKILLTIEPLDGLQAVVEKKSGYCLSSAVDGKHKLTITQSLADLSKNT